MTGRRERKTGGQPTIRASDISRYVFCNRAWWYDQQGYESANIAEMRQGRRFHLSHGLLLRAAEALFVIAVLLIITGVFLAAIYFLQLASGGG